MARLTEEQRRQRALARARREALAREEVDRRLEARREQWRREGTYLSRAEYEAGTPCRGCGKPLLDGRGSWPALTHLTPDEREEHDREEARFREQHGECRSHRWGIEGQRIQHCGYCCPPPPFSERQLEKLGRIFASVRTEQRKRDLDDWDLALTCDHVVRRVQHRDHDHCSAHVVDCPSCGTRRGVVQAQRIGPADDPEGQVQRQRLVEELQASRAKLERQNRSAEKTRRRVDVLSEQLAGLDPARNE